jgi:hypothetical protein
MIFCSNWIPAFAGKTAMTSSPRRRPGPSASVDSTKEFNCGHPTNACNWIPAFAGMTAMTSSPRRMPGSSASVDSTTEFNCGHPTNVRNWIPAFAGMTAITSSPRRMPGSRASVDSTTELNCGHPTNVRNWIPAFAGMTGLVEADVSEKPASSNQASPRRMPGSSAAVDSREELNCCHPTNARNWIPAFAGMTAINPSPQFRSLT